MFLSGGLLAGTTSETPVPVGNPLGLTGATLAVVTAIAYTGLALHFVTLRRELLAVVDQTVQPTRASIWLRPPPSRA